jgi:hypothetical protein
VLTVGLAAAVGLSAYWTALASRPVEAEEPSPQPQPVPRLFAIPKAPEVSPVVRDRAYRRGRRAGIREGRRAARRELRRRLRFPTWSRGGAYVVTATPDGKGIRSRVAIEPGEIYELCPDSKRICVRKRD